MCGTDTVYRLALAILITLAASTMAHAETVNLYAAGSLKAALTEIARAFEAKDPGTRVVAEFAASGLLRELSMPFYLAAVQTEHAELLASLGREEEAHPLLAEARETFERLRATPWLERVDSVGVRQEVKA